MSGPLDHARVLLRKAANDLTAAGATLPTGAALDTVCFHAQQASEKSLKALLAVHDVCYPWTHDLLELLPAVVERWPAVAAFSGDLERLTLYAATVRYDESADPELVDAEEALGIARRLHELAQRLVTASTGAGPAVPRDDPQG